MRITQPIIRNVQQFNDSIATVDGARRKTWGEIGDRVARLAQGLLQIGVNPDDRVGIIALNSDRYLEIFYAVPWAAGVIVPINYRWTTAEIAFALNDSQTEVLFVDKNFSKLIPELRKHTKHALTTISIEGRLTETDEDMEALIASNTPAEEHERHADDISGIFYTGGTTGRSKGVMLTHANHISNSLQFAAVIDMNMDSTYLHAAPMFHMADALYVYLVTHLGGKHIFEPMFEPSNCAQAIQDHNVTDIILVPTMIQMLLQQPGFEKFDLTPLKRIYYGASPMPESVVQDLMKQLPWVEPIQLYGQTESAPLLTWLDSHYHVTEGQFAGRLRSAGKAMPAVEVKIVDEHDKELPRGSVGEIIARGPNIMKGYWGLEELTAETLRNGWLHTGDAAYMDDGGFVFISDRLKDMIISGGENVYSTEVENALYEHTSIAQCAVIGIPDSKWGEKVHAIVVTKDGYSHSSEELITHCRNLIADFKCPKSIAFHDTALPLSGAGKILKTELRKPYWENNNKQVN